MNAKRSDKIATGVLYAVAGIIVLILASLLLYILVRGIPHISWEFDLTFQSLSRRWWDWDSAIQLIVSFIGYNDH